MWLLLAFCSAALLGFYDVFKKKSLNNNAVLPVLALNTLFSSLIFLPFILLSHFAPQTLQGSLFYVPDLGGWEVHKFILLKSLIVLSSWTFGYFGMKHLPLTLVGPINATRPVMTLVGAMLIFGERLNLYQWIGVLMAIISFFMLSRSGKKEGIDFTHNRWIWFVVLAAVLGTVSGLYDKFLMGRFNNMQVQAWYNIYQFFLMGGVSVVAQAQDFDSFPLGLVHHSDFCLPLGCRLRIFLCADHGGFHDFHRFDGTPRQCHRIVLVRGYAVPRKEPEEQSYRPDSGIDWYVLPLSGKPLKPMAQA